MKLLIKFALLTAWYTASATSVFASEVSLELNDRVLTCNPSGQLEWVIDSSLLQASGEHDLLASQALPSFNTCQSLRSIWLSEFAPIVHVTYSIQQRSYEHCHPHDGGCGNWITVETVNIKMDGMTFTSRDKL